MAIDTAVRTFRDLDLNFTRHPVTNDVAVRVGDQAVIRSVRNLVNLNFYEKPFHSEIGGAVRQLLFENLSPLTAQNLKDQIVKVIENFEPRVKLIEVIVQATDSQNYFNVEIKFYIQNNASPTGINLLLERVR